MAAKETPTAKLRLMADKLRIHSIRSTTAAGSGHPTSCLSCAEIMSSLFFSVMKKDDEFILSKGHAAPILWACFAEAGIIPVSSLNTLRKMDSDLEGHPTKNMKMIRVATGSLGQGLSAGLGMALAKKAKKEKGCVYVLLGDGEIAEGSVWEAANTASSYDAGNLIAIADINRLGQSQETMHSHDISKYRKKFEAFGWDAIPVDGHRIDLLLGAFRKARKSSRPAIILAKTFKGKGVSEAENRDGWHGKPFPEDIAEKAVKNLGTPEVMAVKLKSEARQKKIRHDTKDFRLSRYSPGEKIATRTAFGNALVSCGKKNSNAIVIDGDVKNSTMTEGFFRKFPKRSFESFIAEQNMVGMAMGFSASGLMPFAATFAAFLTRAHDFIRMAAYSGSNIKICGSHAGISIGEDGASQMGLEDISMFMSIPESMILYPSDAVSAENCVKIMAKHNGISYIRTTRAKTPVIYNNDEKFRAGGLKVIRKSRNDSALIIGAGITLHEALKAHDALKKEGISARVIDLYSVKPISSKALKDNAEECRGRVIVVEDHYSGGIGSAVREALPGCRIEHLYVKEIPRSGNPEQLMKRYSIDSSAIARAVRKQA